MNNKKILLLLLLLLPFIALAEYNGHQIEFTIELKDGNKIRGYNFLADVYQKDKSISYKVFLEKNYEIVLSNQFTDSVGAFAYFQHRIKYNYTDFGGTNTFIFTLTDKKAIDLHQIKSFKIIELSAQSYAIGISTFHNYEDRLWMAAKSEEQYSFGGHFCTHGIFIHEKSAETDQIIRELEILERDFELKVKAQEAEMEYSDGEPYYEAKEKIEELFEGIDEKVSALLGKFDGMKVVIITMCTC